MTIAEQNNLIQTIRNRAFCDLIQTFDLTIGTFGGTSDIAQLYPKQNNYGALVIPRFAAYDGNGAILSITDTRHPILIKMTSETTQRQFIPNGADLWTLNDYYRTDGAKPIAIGPNDKIDVTAIQVDTQGYGASNDFTTIVVKCAFVMQYITPTQYLQIAEVMGWAS